MTAALPGDWLLPQWPAPASVRAVCSTRQGGVSWPPWDSMNLGDHVGDDPQDVARNRALFAQALGGARPVFLQQVHGTGVLPLSAQTPHGLAADACWTREPQLACTMMVADCLPILLCDKAGTQVAAVHAGWRGLAHGVVEAAVASFEGRALMAWLGPCIGPQAFEVGPEVKAAFEAVDPAAAAHFKAVAADAARARGGLSGERHEAGASPKWLADLAALARQRLHRAGVLSLHGNDSSPAWCTVTGSSRFFSYRRDGICGRFAASIWLV